MCANSMKFGSQLFEGGTLSETKKRHFNQEMIPKLTHYLFWQNRAPHNICYSRKKVFLMINSFSIEK